MGPDAAASSSASAVASAFASILRSTDYFINRSAGGNNSDRSDLASLSTWSDAAAAPTPGFWEPHTSSIDFCEPNYALSPYVAEPHNALSSLLGISLLGLVGIARGNPTGETRFYLLYLVLTLVGLGSFALHVTLHWAPQSSDELPMIYLVALQIYCCLETYSPPPPTPRGGSPGGGRGPLDRRVRRFPRSGGGGVRRPALLPSLLTALCLAETALYFRFREAYAVFLSSFASAVGALLVLHVRLALGIRRGRGRRGGGERPPGRGTGAAAEDLTAKARAGERTAATWPCGSTSGTTSRSC